MAWCLPLLHLTPHLFLLMALAPSWSGIVCGISGKGSKAYFLSWCFLWLSFKCLMTFAKQSSNSGSSMGCTVNVSKFSSEASHCTSPQGREAKCRLVPFTPLQLLLSVQFMQSFCVRTSSFQQTLFQDRLVLSNRHHSLSFLLIVNLVPRKHYKCLSGKPRACLSLS